MLFMPIMQRLCIKYRPIKPLRHQGALSKINTFKKRYLLYTLLYFFAYCCGKCVNNHGIRDPARKTKSENILNTCIMVICLYRPI